MTEARTTPTLAGMNAFIEHSPLRLAIHVDEGIAFLDSDTVNAEAALLQMLESAPPGSLIPIDFSDVRVASAAARRLLKRPILRLRAGELADRYVVLEDLGESEDNVSIMLRDENLPMVERTNSGPRLLGSPDVAVDQTWSFLAARPVSTASEVKEALALTSISSATNRLTSLAKLCLARRIDQRTVPGGGREFVYSAVR